MSGPYTGIKVIDTTGLTGAYATRLFAGLGAEVVRLEPPEGSSLRRLAPFVVELLGYGHTKRCHRPRR